MEHSGRTQYSAIERIPHPRLTKIAITRKRARLPRRGDRVALRHLREAGADFSREYTIATMQ